MKYLLSERFVGILIADGLVGKRLPCCGEAQLPPPD
jgi:hypothetical protein